MSKETFDANESGVLRRNLEALTRPAKIVGVTVLSGLVGYAASKGFDTFVMPVERSEAYEVVAAGYFALMGAFVASESIDR